MMRLFPSAVLATALITTLIAAPLAAQQPAPASAPAPATVASAAEIAALSARAAREIKPGQPLVALLVMAVGPWRAMLEYRQAGAPASLHKTQIEIFQVVSGAGQFVTGGTLEGTRDVDAANQAGTGIAGGTSRRVAAGDMMAVPAGVPHWIPSVEGPLVLISLKVPTP